MKIEIATDADKADLIAQYTWAQDRLDEIIAESSWTNAKVISAVQDEAKILRKTLRILKKIITHELR